MVNLLRNKAEKSIEELETKKERFLDKYDLQSAKRTTTYFNLKQKIYINIFIFFFNNSTY